MLPGRIVYSVIFFGLVMSLVLVTRPPAVFLPDGRLRQFGLEGDQTLFSFGSVAVLTAIGSMFVFSLLDVRVTR